MPKEVVPLDFGQAMAVGLYGEGDPPPLTIPVEKWEVVVHFLYNRGLRLIPHPQYRGEYLLVTQGEINAVNEKIREQNEKENT